MSRAVIGHRARLAAWVGLGLTACTVGLPPYVDKSDSADTGDTDTTQAVDTPDSPPSDTPVDTPDPDVLGRAGAQGCAGALSSSDGTYSTVGCLAPWSVSGAAAAASDGQWTLQPGALRRIVP